MAPKGILRLLSCITFLFLTTVTLFVQANFSSTFTSIKHLQGCKKGQNVKDLHILKSYLQQFGYLNYQNHPNQSTLATDDYFDDQLEAAVKTYQVNYRLEPSGVLDADTTFKMALPRCGVPDISDGINHILASRNKRRGRDHGNHTNLHTISHYSFFRGHPKWNKKQLSYNIYGKMSPAFKTAIDGAFKKWASASKYFTFTPALGGKTSDIKVGFERGAHGCATAFDGAGPVLAHAKPPMVGILHFDADEKWVVGAVALSFDLGSVALHEMGHLLGLMHSDVKAAIMYSVAPMAGTKGLHADDIKGIKTLYNVRT